jgi:hypothetical protein
MWPDSYNMNSFKDFDSFCESDFLGQKALRYLENHVERIRELVSTNIQEAISGERVFSVEDNLPYELQQNFLNETPYELFFKKFK